jgi:hypothetical protein
MWHLSTPRALGHACGPLLQIIAHAKWHARLADMDMRRRVALAAWRAQRDAARAAGLAAAGTAGGGAAASEASEVR